MARAQNTHAHVNAGFLFTLTAQSIVQTATVVYGNINDVFIHATQTEQLLLNKNLFSNTTLQAAYNSLSVELKPDDRPPDPGPVYRKALAIALFYKAILSIAPDDKVSARNKSGGKLLTRPISTGTQDYETQQSLYPVTEPIPKLEAQAQCSGEAQYIIDKPDLPHQLYGVLILAKARAGSTITNIDASRALRAEGVVAFYSADDIPGDNSFTPLYVPFVSSNELIFVSKVVKYYDQPLGILVGHDERALEKAADLVGVTYIYSTDPPVLSARQILNNNLTNRLKPSQTMTPTRRGNNIKHVYSGNFDIYAQYHFHMETHCCYVVPNENGLDVYPSSQWMDLIQNAIAKMLKIPESKIYVVVRRCGGAFGGKISRNGILTCAVALAAWKLRKPVRSSMTLETNMSAVGKRFPMSINYEVGVDDGGVIQYLNASLYSDAGIQTDEDISNFILAPFRGIYVTDTFNIALQWAITDTPVNTWARAPGSTEGVAFLEYLMEEISFRLNLDPINVRIANLPANSPLIQYLNKIRDWANIAARKQTITTYNQNNRWKKRGLATVLMTFDINKTGPHFTKVSIFHGDGSVEICHGGIEMGQGINTKVAQVVAYKLNIPLNKITVMPSNTFTAANNLITGGSFASEAICYGAIVACDQLLTRIQPYRQTGLSWEQVIEVCQQNFVQLFAVGEYSAITTDVESYHIYGVCACEVEVDVLTGQHNVTRVDLIEDTGNSISPLIDIGQVEGAFIMGLGYNTTEHIVYDPKEGKLLTNNTWTYYPPGVKDIPVDFRVMFPKNNPNPVGVLKSKATGEPPLTLSIAVPLAIRYAIASARGDAGLPREQQWCKIDGPTTVEDTFNNCSNNFSQYVL